MKRTPKAVRDCAKWLEICICLGWSKSDLGWLEKLWWKCKELGQFPTPVCGRWYIEGQCSGTYDSPEAAADAMTKGGAE